MDANLKYVTLENEFFYEMIPIQPTNYLHYFLKFAFICVHSRFSFPSLIAVAINPHFGG